MGNLVSQGPCPYCASSDAFTQYNDGGHHCFSCGTHQKANPYKQLLANRPEDLAKAHFMEVPRCHGKALCPPIPEDSRAVYGLVSPSAGLRGANHWLAGYKITEAEIDKNQMLWSESEQLLIFPVFGAHGLIVWQGRYFGPKPRHPKYLTRGLKESVLHIIGLEKKGPLVLTEDLLSAIKVGRQQPAMPLWGSSLSKEQAQRLGLLHDSVYLWLDYDKREESIRIARQRCLFLGIIPIITRLDPKDYDDNEIKEYLKGA